MSLKPAIQSVLVQMKYMQNLFLELYDKLEEEVDIGLCFKYYFPRTQLMSMFSVPQESLNSPGSSTQFRE